MRARPARLAARSCEIGSLEGGRPKQEGRVTRPLCADSLPDDVRRPTHAARAAPLLPCGVAGVETERAGAGASSAPAERGVATGAAPSEGAARLLVAGRGGSAPEATLGSGEGGQDTDEDDGAGYGSLGDDVQHDDAEGEDFDGADDTNDAGHGDKDDVERRTDGKEWGGYY